jgi:Cu/Ag efflux protein CusF
MNKLMTAAAAAALLTASSFAAFAAEVTGSITSIDVAAGTIVLDDGKTYQVAAMQDTNTGNASSTTAKSTSTPAELASFKPGDKVKITFDEVDGKFVASSVAPATM